MAVNTKCCLSSFNVMMRSHFASLQVLVPVERNVDTLFRTYILAIFMTVIVYDCVVMGTMPFGYDEGLRCYHGGKWQ